MRNAILLTMLALIAIGCASRKPTIRDDSYFSRERKVEKPVNDDNRLYFTLSIAPQLALIAVPSQDLVSYGASYAIGVSQIPPRFGIIVSHRFHLLNNVAGTQVLDATRFDVNSLTWLFYKPTIHWNIGYQNARFGPAMATMGLALGIASTEQKTVTASTTTTNADLSGLAGLMLGVEGFVFESSLTVFFETTIFASIPTGLSQTGTLAFQTRPNYHFELGARTYVW